MRPPVVVRLALLWTGSIRRRLVIGVSGLVSVLMALFVWQMVERQRDFVRRHGDELAVAVAKMIASGSEPWVLANDLMGLAETLASAPQLPNLHYLMVVSPEGRVLAHSDRSRVGSYLHDKASLALLAGAPKARVAPRSRLLADAVAPVMVRNALIGWVIVGISEQQLAESLIQISQSGLLYAIAAILFGGALVGGIVRRLSRGLNELVGLTSALAAGEASVRAPSCGVDELGVLNKAFNAMAETLERNGQELHRRQQEFRALVENAPNPIVRYDRDCRRIYVNAAALALAGRRQADELVGRAAADSGPLASFEADRLAQAIRRVVETGEPAEIELECRSASGRTRYYRDRLAPERGRDGQVASVLTLATDVTELIETQRSLRALVENLPDMVSRFDCEGRCLYANPAMAQVLGSTAGALGGTAPELGPPCAREALERLHAGILATVAERGPASFEAPWPLPGGERCFEIRTIPEKDGQEQVASVLMVARDITERKQAEAEIAALNRELALRLDALKEAHRELESFSYSVSHDLKIPLRAIDGFAGVVLEERGERLGEEGARYLGVVRRNAARMLRLIDGLLDFVSLSQRPLRLECVDMGGLAREVFEELRSAEPGRSIRFAARDLPPARCDRAMLRQALANLLGNAIKFTSPRREAAIEIGGLEKEGENAYFVRDNGVGFDMRYVDKLFGVFLRLHAPEEFEGPGVGLAIVKRIIDRHGGRVWAESRVEEGAVFHFTLPRSGPQ